MIKIVKSLVVIIAVAAVAVGATGAYFNDQEVVAGNSFTAGSLDLQLGENTTPFSLSNIAPGQSGSKTITLTNAAGSIDAALDVKLDNIVQLENGITEPEQGLNGEYTPNSGELGMFLNFVAFVDVDKNGSFNNGDIQLAYNGVLPYSQINYFAGWKTTNPILSWNDITTMTGGQSVDLVINWNFPTESQDGNYSQNIAMTDGITFDLKASLEQVGGNGGVAE